MSDITQILQQCQTGDDATRRNAELTLKKWRETNLGEFFVAMCKELCDASKPPLTRHLAGLMIKTSLEAKDQALGRARAKQWGSLQPQVRNMIKQYIVNGLGLKLSQGRRACAQIIAEVARIELPTGQWPQLIPGLMNNVTSPSRPDIIVESSVESIGYICDKLDSDALDKKSRNNILTAIVAAMMRKGKDEIRYRGCLAMFEALYFVQDNFENAGERDQIMKAITHCAIAPSCPKVRKQAYECIYRVAECYYEKLQPYIKDLFQKTLFAVKQDQPEVGIKAIEFWLTLCDCEAELIYEEDAKCQNYVKTALGPLLQTVFALLVKQEEDDDDSWNLAKAGGCLLQGIANCVVNDVVSPVMQFVQHKHRSKDWRDREAAVLAFGSILTDDTAEGMQNIAMKFLPFALQCLRGDPNGRVRDTAAWTTAMCCGQYGSSLNPQMMGLTVGTLMQSLALPPKIASNVCFACHNLAQSIENARMSEANTNPLSPHLKKMVAGLLQCADRKDAEEANVRTAAYEAINLIMSSAAQDSIAVVKDLLGYICKKLDAVLSQTPTKESAILQGLLCGVIQTAVNRLGKDVLPFGDHVMERLLKVFKAQDATAHEESFMAIGALANAMDEHFQKYVSALSPYLATALGQHQQVQLCIVATGVLGDLTRSLEGKLSTEFCTRLVQLLLKNLTSPTMDRKCKPPILGVFGDLALSCGHNFEMYMQHVMTLLIQAGQTALPNDPEDDPETYEFVIELRGSILDALAGILQGMKGKPAVIMPYKGKISMFLMTVTNDPNREDEDTRKIAGVLGDLISALNPNNMRQVIGHEFVATIVRDCAASTDPDTRDSGDWVQSVIKGEQ